MYGIGGITSIHREGNQRPDNFVVTNLPKPT